MKKYLYYISPFVLVPALTFLCEYIQNATGLISFFPYYVISLVLLSAVEGNLSPTAKKFDYVMTLFMTMSLFCLMFIGGFLDKSDLGTRFELDKAFKCAFEPTALILYGIMGLITFLSSYKGFRAAKLLKSKAQ